MCAWMVSFRELYNRMKMVFFQFFKIATSTQLSKDRFKCSKQILHFWKRSHVTWCSALRRTLQEDLFSDYLAW